MRVRSAAVLLCLYAVFPARAQEDALTLTFLGDIMIHTVNYCVPDYADIYAAVAPCLRRDDLTFANLEFPLDASRPYAGYPRFNGSLAYARAAVEAGVDVFSLANNHSFDQGRAGVLQTIRSMEKLSLLTGRRLSWSGLRGNLERPLEPVEIRVRGFRIGFLAVTQLLNRPQTHPYVPVADYRDPAPRRVLLERVRAAAPAYDLFIVSYHGGIEYALQAAPEKIAFFRELVDAGAHIVWAHHPHVPQPALRVPARDGDRLIIASAGNLISGMRWDADPEKPEDPLAFTGDSALWSVRVIRRNGAVTVAEVRPQLVTNFRNGDGALVVTPFSGLLCGELPASWRGYYRRRLRLLRAHLSGDHGEAGGEAPVGLTGAQ